MQHSAQSEIPVSERLDVRQVPPGDLRPHPRNLRQVVKDDGFAELVGSMKSLGILEPLVAVLDKDGGLLLVAGHRRQAAALEAGLQSVPVLVRSLTDFQVVEAMLSENQLRSNLSPKEEGEGYRYLIESGAHTVQTLSARIGCSSARIYTALQFTEDGPDLLQAVATGQIPPSVASLVRSACKYTGTTPQVFLQCLGSEFPNDELTATQVRAFCKTYKERHDRRIAEIAKEAVEKDRKGMQAAKEQDAEGERFHKKVLKDRETLALEFLNLTVTQRVEMLRAEYFRTKPEGQDLDFWAGLLDRVWPLWFRDPETVTGESYALAARAFRDGLKAYKTPERKRNHKGKVRK
jgi:ParB/RepB/Spo0J family partition protein